MIRRMGTTVLELQLDAPETHNALTLRDLDDLATQLEQAAAEAAVRVVVISAVGSVFCSGADMSELDGPASLRHFESLLQRVAVAIGELPQPVVCRVQGAVFGGGLVIVGASDISVMVESGVLGLPEARFGFVATAAAVACVRRMGPAASLDAFLTGHRMTAADAQRSGLVSRVTSREKLDTEVTTVVNDLLQGAPLALGWTKRLVRSLLANPADDGYAVAMRFPSDASPGEVVMATEARSRRALPGWVSSWDGPS